MNEKQARQEGLQFTGKYARFYQKELVTQEALRIRKLGFRAVTVESKSGFSVYASTEYFQALYKYETYQRAIRGIPFAEAEIQKHLDMIEIEKQKIEEYKKILAEPEPLKVR